MPYFPYSDRDPSTGQYSGRTPLGGFLDRASSAVCAALGAIERWSSAAYRAAGIPSGAAGLLSGRPIFESICEPFGGVPPTPIVPGVPPFPVNCDTFGTIVYRQQSFPQTNPPTWSPPFDVTWTCGQNFGRPIGGPSFFQFTPSIFGYRLRFERADGAGETSLAIGQYPTDTPAAVQIVSIDIQYCPSCNLPPPPPIPPEIPEDDDPPDPDEPPIINIDIDFPTLPGLPPISFPVTYSPTLNFNTPINVQPTLVLAPRVDLNPNFAFAPNIEFSFGGISIGGGGYPEPRPDVTTILECDCPDPCPPGGDVDYERIATIVRDRLDAVRDIPGTELAVSLGPVNSGEEVSFGLPDGVRGILYEVDISSYTGGASFASSTERSVFYPGYAWFGFDENFPGGERVFINAIKGYLECPAFANRFTAICKDGATISARWVSTAGFPDP